MRAARVLLTIGGHTAFALAAIAQPPPGYYDPAAGLTGQALKQALHDIIDDHTVLSYSGLWLAFYTTDDRIDAHVWDIYSDVPGGTPPYLYTFGADQCGTYSGEGDCYNREHSFPLSWFDDAPPMDTDLHHIYPTDGWVNQKRGNLPYGVVGSTDFTSMNGTKTGSNTWPGYGGDVCEPIDAFKGDLARTYFYMMTRYLPQIPGWSSDMLQSGDLAPWAEAMLLQWHADDPVSTKETDRNNAVFAEQDNRNPYVDHPEWVTSIWGPFASIGDAASTALRINVRGTDVEVLGSAGTYDLVIIDLAGRLILHERSAARTTTLPPLPHGAYQLMVTAPTGRCSARFVH